MSLLSCLDRMAIVWQDLDPEFTCYVIRLMTMVFIFSLLLVSCLLMLNLIARFINIFPSFLVTSLSPQRNMITVIPPVQDSGLPSTSSISVATMYLKYPQLTPHLLHLVRGHGKHQYLHKGLFRHLL